MTIRNNKAMNVSLPIPNEEFLDMKCVNGSTFEYTLTDLDFAFLSGNYYNGKMTFPVSGYLVLTWCAFAKLNGKTLSETPIVFKNVQSKKTVFDSSGLKLQVTILLGSGKFEIFDSGVMVATGTISLTHDPTTEKVSARLDCSSEINLLPLSSEDIYKEFALRGYSYSGAFRGIQSCNQLIKSGVLYWNHNWISFIDGMLQFENLRVNNRNLYFPNRLERVLIDPKAHLISVLGNHNEIPIRIYANIKVIVAGGIEIEDINWRIEPRNRQLLAKHTQHVLLYHKNGLSRQKNKQNLQEVEHAYVSASPTGELSKIRWIMSSLHTSESSPELCQVYYTALNYQDLAIAKANLTVNELSDKHSRRLGVEFSGRTSSGKRVMGIVKSGALATEVLTEKPFIWEVPPNWTLKAAASVPISFVTAYFALVVKGQIKPNQTVLVYSRASDLGLAAINLALHTGCKIFATRDKKNYMKSRFLEIPMDNMGFDWDPKFEKMVLERTNYHGVDLVVNFLGEEKISAGMRCLCAGGKFLHIGQLDSDTLSQTLDLSVFGNNKSFQVIQIDSMTEAEKEIVAQYVADGITNGQIFPTSHTEIFLPDQLEEAFSYLSETDLIKKIIVATRFKEAPGRKNNSEKILAVPKTYMSPDKTYILIDGVHGLGLVLAQWLVTRGATKLVLSSNDGVQTGYQTLCIRRWREKGVKVIVSTIDCTTIEGAKDLLLEATALGPVGGIFDLRVHHQVNNTNNDHEAMKNSVKGIKSIDAASREHGVSQVDHFVLFAPVPDDQKDSKINSIVSTITEIVEERKNNGYSGIVVCLGGIDGVLNAGKVIPDKLDSFKSVPQQIESITEALDSLLIQNHSAVEVKLVQ